jgi:hypothetical protein
MAGPGCGPADPAAIPAPTIASGDPMNPPAPGMVWDGSQWVSQWVANPAGAAPAPTTTIAGPTPDPTIGPGGAAPPPGGGNPSLDALVNNFPPPPEPLPPPQLPPPPTFDTPVLPPPPELPTFTPRDDMPTLPKLSDIAKMPSLGSREVQRARIDTERSIAGRSGRKNSFLTSTTRKSPGVPTLAQRRFDYARTAG